MRIFPGIKIKESAAENQVVTLTHDMQTPSMCKLFMPMYAVGFTITLELGRTARATSRDNTGSKC